MSDHFRYYLRVRYAECDAQRVVFNARYGDYLELATTEFLRALGLDGSMVTGRYDYQLVKQTLEWKSSARFDQVLELSVHAPRLGNTSFTVATEFRIAGEDRIVATGETVYVLVIAETMEKSALSDEVREVLKRGGAGMLTDHAGYFNSPMARGIGTDKAGGAQT
jgi:acyl-CoA thioester hydrolase